MLCKALSIRRNSRMSRSVFFDVFHVLMRISEAKDESSFSCILSISKSVGNSLLSLPAALSDLLVQGVFYQYLKNFSLHLFHQTYLLKFLVQKTCLFVL